MDVLMVFILFASVILDDVSVSARLDKSRCDPDFWRKMSCHFKEINKARFAIFELVSNCKLPLFRLILVYEGLFVDLVDQFFSLI